MAQKSLRDAVITISDGGSAQATIKVGEGNISWSEKQTVEYTRDRGAIDGARLGDDEACEVKFDILWDWISSSGGGSGSGSGTPVVEIIKGQHEGAVSTATEGECAPYACDLRIDIYGCDVDEIQEVLTFSDFRWESLDYDLRAGQISCSGRIMDREPTVTAE